MRPAVLATSIVLAFAVVPIVATANPGDPSVLQGTLVWLPGTGEPFTVVRADDGRHFVVDLSAAQTRGTIGGVGDRVSVVGAGGWRGRGLGSSARRYRRRPCGRGRRRRGGARATGRPPRGRCPPGRRPRPRPSGRGAASTERSSRCRTPASRCATRTDVRCPS